MKVSNILVANVTIKQQIQDIYQIISNLNIKVSDILVYNVTTKQHKQTI